MAANARRDPEDELDGGESLNQFYERVRATFGDHSKSTQFGSDSHCWPFPYESNDSSRPFWSNPPASHFDPAGQ